MVLVDGTRVSNVFLYIGHEVHRPHVQILIVREDDNEIWLLIRAHGANE